MYRYSVHKLHITHTTTHLLCFEFLDLKMTKILTFFICFALQNRVHSSVPVLQREPSEPPPDLRLLRLWPRLRPLHDPLLSLRRIPRKHLHDVRTSGISFVILIFFKYLIKANFVIFIHSQHISNVWSEISYLKKNFSQKFEISDHRGEKNDFWEL